MLCGVFADDSTVVKFEIPAPTAENPEHKQMVTSHSKIDSFGRKLFDELQLGTGFVSYESAALFAAKINGGILPRAITASVDFSDAEE
jgi:hypothetical protein